ncbi:hypothetical protein ACQP1O_38405 [Nocardia sp. CA-151230]|uniref:hypothetical protein n=1 Tax=Nocardia sp. CA-151230 TaxID=3239982 RepID=UPI003D8B5E6B
MTTQNLTGDQPESGDEPKTTGHPVALVPNGQRPSATWSIVGATCGLAAIVVGLVALGLANHWGIAQFGTVSTWVFGSVTLTALVLAFSESRRSIRESAKSEERTELQRQIDHEIDRRRETSKAIADLWSAIAAEALSVNDVLNFFDDLPYSFDLNVARNEEVSTPLAVEIHDVVKAFVQGWLHNVEGPLLYALVVTKGTKLDQPTRQLNKDVRSLVDGAIPALTNFAMTQQHIPETQPVRDLFSSITKRRQDFLDLMRDHLALDWATVTSAVMESSAPNRL